MTNVEYKLSLRKSKYAGYQSKNKNNGIVKSYISTIWRHSKNSFSQFVDDLNYYILVERICLERGFQKIRLHDRCNSFIENNEIYYGCKMDYIAYNMLKEE